MKALAAIGGAAAAFFVLLLVLVMIVFFLYIGAVNGEARIRADFDAQQKVNESSFDKMWKIIQQSASVPEAERESFRKTYVEIMQATQGVAGNGQLASFFTQAKIDISPDLFAKLMTSIESQRESFHRDQMKLLQIKAEHDKILTVFPSSLFLAGKQRLDAKIVTSGRTDQAFATGKDDDVELFKKTEKLSDK